MLRVFQCAGTRQDREHRLEIVAATARKRVADQRRVGGRADAERADQRQGRLAFCEVIAEILADRIEVARIIENVVYESRPGQWVRASPSRRAPSEISQPRERRASTAATARAAFSAWCMPSSGTRRSR